jgi:NAD(P)-dependent dehydrogenase (short-subunit alcohol dehydrogenase family)
MSDIKKAQQLFDLTGEIALVTGASSGLGARFAKVLTRHGAKVILAARRLEKLKALQREIAEQGGEAMALPIDVLDASAVPPALDRAEQDFGTITCLVNNAGIARPRRALDLAPEDWQKVIDTNLTAVWRLAQEAGRRMVNAGVRGTIINIASILGMRVERGEVAYSAAKAGVLQITRTLAVELARHNIRVNAIAPGYILTEMTETYLKSPKGEAMVKAIPQQRFGQPSDLDGTLLLLASHEASGFMTGSTIVVDGGDMWTSG